METLNLPTNMNQFLLRENEWRNIRGQVIRHRNEYNQYLDQNGNIIRENDMENQEPDEAHEENELLTGGNAIPVNDFGEAIEGAANNPIIIDEEEVERIFGGGNRDDDLDIVLNNPEENERRLRGENLDNDNERPLRIEDLDN